MPHQCTNCGRTFDDGSKQMLAGCPDCGGNKFQFLPPGTVEREAPEEPLDGAAASGGDDDIIEAPPEPVANTPAGEDRAQATARSSVVSENELPPAEPHYGAEEPPAPAEEPESPDLAQLREELNEQFESIKILRPGEYELNLMELYDREEYIIALEEDGRYVIDVPDTWRDDG